MGWGRAKQRGARQAGQCGLRRMIGGGGGGVGGVGATIVVVVVGWLVGWLVFVLAVVVLWS